MLSTEELLRRIHHCLPLLQYEHYAFLKIHRYNSDQLEGLTPNSPLLQLMRVIKSRLQYNPQSITADQFMTLLGLQERVLIGQQNNSDLNFKQFRLVRHYDPFTISFIRKHIFSHKNNSEMLVYLLKAYGILRREGSMMFIYPEFFEELYSNLVRPGILEKMSDNTLTDLVLNVGYLNFRDRSVDTILAHFKDTLDARMIRL